jgi:heptosyltransferase-2
VLWPGVALPCAPCYDGQNFAECASNRCLQMIAPDDVATAVDGLCAH